VKREPDCDPTASTPSLILASSSPRRRELLARAGYRFEVVPPEAEEPARLGPTPAQAAVERARAKARDVARRFPDRVVLAADTLVVLDGDIIGKPRDPEDARRILRRLRGTRHSVLTAVVVRFGEAEEVGVEETAVVMRAVSDEEIDAYVATGEALGKAGAYAVQERGDRFIERLEGSYTNVVGLPMELVAEMLRKVGVRPRTEAEPAEPGPGAESPAGEREGDKR